jgi:hypothetical protein
MMPAQPPGTPGERRCGALLGRDRLVAEVNALLHAGQNILLVGPRDVGKSALIHALGARAVVVIDPFERVSPHLAARIRRAMGRGTVHLAAARTLDRAHLGAVRRIIFWFTVVRVPPLTEHWMQRLVRRECLAWDLGPDVATPPWVRTVSRLARGRPGLALAMVRVAAAMYATRGALPSPAVACIEANIERAEARAWRRTTSVGVDSRPVRS